MSGCLTHAATGCATGTVLVIDDDFEHSAASSFALMDFERAYSCEPPVMIKACNRILMQGRLFERDILTKKFLSTAGAATCLARSPLFQSN